MTETPPPAPATQPRSARFGAYAFWIIALSLVAWGLGFIWTTTFVHEGRRVFCLMDDAMISMTYARNLVEGYGLNWARRGEPVEGFTHPLWVLLMVPAHLLPFDSIHVSLAVQLLSLACLVANLYVLRRLTSRHFTNSPEDPSWVPAVALTAAYYPLNHWALQGMETALQALFFTSALHLCLDVMDGRRTVVPLFGTLGLALMLRLDMAVMVVPVLVALLLKGHKAPAASWRRGWFVLLALPLAYQGFRWTYFGDLLPNTYNLKMTGVPAAVRIYRGYLVLLDSLRPCAAFLVAILIGSLALARTKPKVLLPLATLLLALAYSVYVGGDVWEWSSVAANRFVAWAMPGAFMLAGALLSSLPLGRNAVLRWSAVVLVSLAGVFSFDGLWPSPVAERRWRAVLLRDPPLHTEDNAALFAELDILRARLGPGATVATVWGGIPAYFSDFKLIDAIGYNDRHIARVESPRNLTLATARDYHPGHMKWDWEYVLGSRPDLVFQTWGHDDEELESLLRRHGYRLWRDYWVLAGSPWFRRLPTDEWSE